VGQAGVPAGGDDDADREVQLTAFARGQLSVKRTAGLEDATVLQELILQPDLVRSGGGQGGRAPHEASDPVLGGKHVPATEFHV
jgi:hypothetical protein